MRSTLGIAPVLATDPVRLGDGPTWTNPHTFSALLTANLGLTVAGAAFKSRGIADNATANALTIASTGGLTVTAPASGPALSVTSVASTSGNNSAVVVKGSTTSGQSWGVQISAGTTSADRALWVLNAANSASLFQVSGDGSVLVGSSVTGQGAGVINVANSYCINGVRQPIYSAASANSGWGTPTGGAAVASFPGASATLVQCSTAIAQLLTILKTAGVIAA
jgi:hypothetical protein